MTCQKKCCTDGARRAVKKVLCIILVVAVLVWIDANFNILSSSRANKQAHTRLQAVFLTNGQVYFGTLSRHGIGYWRLDNTHYLQVSKTPSLLSLETLDGPAPQETRTTLLKLSDDMHQPEGTIIIPATNILFWQNLQNSSPVAQAIISGK
ncbi:MAG: hypothetical protein NUV61_01895 [Candidatus Azambacteria bacterium]|nr:hypothetical protein [Candidatus Azambacteria bacterium]